MAGGDGYCEGFLLFLGVSTKSLWNCPLPFLTYITCDIIFHQMGQPNMKDLKFVEEVVELIEKEEIPAPAPIEQRWTPSNKSLMSSASSSFNDDIFSWVGIIMYLPTTDARQRKQITEKFFHYKHLTQTRFWDQYSAYEHAEW